MRVREEIRIERPVEDVFPYVADLSNVSEWDPAVDESRRIGENEFELVAGFLGRRLALRYSITEREEHRRFVAEGRTVDTATFEPAGSGTRLTWQVDLETNRFLEPLLRPVLRRYARKALAGLKTTLERGR